MDAVIELAQRAHCDLALAHDPDADRLGLHSRRFGLASAEW